jgi:hypothetical protein
MMLDLRCEEDNTFLSKYRGVAEDLREGKVEIAFQVEGGRVTGFSEQELYFQAVDWRIPVADQTDLQFVP